MAYSGNDFTVLELKESFRKLGLTTGRSKAELIKRLESDDPNVWEELDAWRRSVLREIDLINFEDVSGANGRSGKG